VTDKQDNWRYEEIPNGRQLVCSEIVILATLCTLSQGLRLHRFFKYMYKLAVDQ